MTMPCGRATGGDQPLSLAVGPRVNQNERQKPAIAGRLGAIGKTGGALLERFRMRHLSTRLTARRGVAALALTAATWACPAVAADGLDLAGTMRLRYEGIANQLRPGFDQDDDLVNLRTTLGARYQSGGFIAVGELWDSRVWGEERGTPVTTGEVNALELVQAYVGVSEVIGKTKVTAQAGRFTLNVGSRRLIAADDYRNTTSGYTGVHIDVAAPAGVVATILYVMPQQRRPDDFSSLRRAHVTFDHEGLDLVLWGGTAAKAKALGPVTAEASFYHLGEHDQAGRPTRDRSLDTYGGRLIRDPLAGAIDGELEAYYQSGSISASTVAGAPRLAVSAWFVHVDGGYSLHDHLHTRLSLEYDRASGDRPGGRYGRFDTLFGMRRADFAPSGLFNAVARANISTPGARIEIVPSSRWDASASYHAIWLAERTDSFSTIGVRDASGGAGDFAGNQVEGRLRWWVRPGTLRFEADGVVLDKGHFLASAPNAAHGGDTTFYGSLNLTASF
jgi:hypothetical protein